MPEMEDILGVAAVVIGIGLYLWRNKRKFDRTNKAGIEQFNGYSGKLFARLVDGMLFIIALACVMGGVIGLAFVHHSTWGWIVLLPLFGFWIFIFFFARAK